MSVCFRLYRRLVWSVLSFFFNDTATTEIYTLSLHDALPISGGARRPSRQQGRAAGRAAADRACPGARDRRQDGDRKSTRLNSSHGYISYAVFCLKKKKKEHHSTSLYAIIQLAKTAV